MMNSLPGKDTRRDYVPVPEREAIRVINTPGNGTYTFIEKKPHSLRYNDGKLKWSMIDRKALEPMIRVLMYGAHKYSRFTDNETGAIVLGKDLPDAYDRHRYVVLTSGVDNWKINFEIRDLFDSLERHITAVQSGEENDPESGLPHIGHILCNAMFISHYMNKGQKY